MEEMQNNNLNPNQQPQPQEEEEKKKKNKFVAWWLGLGKWAKVGICAGTAAVLATGITLGIVLPKNNKSGSSFKGFTLKDNFIGCDVGADGELDFITDPADLSLSNAKFDFAYSIDNQFKCSVNAAEKKVIGKCLKSDASNVNVTFTITLDNISFSQKFEIGRQ